MSEIREITSARFRRVGAHSHIKGLGLKGLKALPVADGMVGQVKAREAAGIIVKMIKEGKMAGRAILLAGPVGSGKTAIAYAIAKELGEDVPFISISGSEVYSAEIKKSEVLMQAMRKAIGVRIHEYRQVYEGEITELDIKFEKNPYNPYQQVPVGAVLGLRTKKEEKRFNVGQNIAIGLINQGCRVGDIIEIDAETGRVVRLGRSMEAKRTADIEAERYVPVPDGTILKEKEFVYTVTLHDLDEMQARRGSFLSLLFGGGEEKEISPEIREEVDTKVKELVNAGRAEIIPGVLFIDEVHMLDIELFSFLCRAMESELAPIIILATNRGIARIRGTDYKSPHGMPPDLLDRLLIIITEPYSRDEIKKILEIRAKEENVKISEKALDYLTSIGEKHSLRYAVQLLTPAYVIAKENGRDEVTLEDIKKVTKLFSDVSKSARYLKELEEKFITVS